MISSQSKAHESQASDFYYSRTASTPSVLTCVREEDWRYTGSPPLATAEQPQHQQPGNYVAVGVVVTSPECAKLPYIDRLFTVLNDTELRNPWQSMKTQRTMSMTVEAWEELGNLASNGATSRSEVLEILIRSASRQKIDLGEERSALLVDKLI